MNTKDFHPTERTRIERDISIIVNQIGLEATADLLLEGAEERGVEMVEDPYWRGYIEEAITTEGILADAVAGVDGAINSLESFILTGERQRVQEQAERGFDRVNTIEARMNSLPGWLAEQLLYESIEQAENGTMSTREEYEELLGLRQIEAEWFGMTQNTDERKRLWSQALAFRRISIDVYHNDTRTGTQVWTNNPMQARNSFLNRIREEVGLSEFSFEKCEVRIEEMFMPNTDPLEDIEGFVHRW